MATRMKQYKYADFLQKYGGKPFTGKQAGKNWVLTQIANFLCQMETGQPGEPLYDGETNTQVLATVHAGKEYDLYQRYYRLAQWQSVNYNTARSFEATIRGLLYYNIELMSSTVKSEMLERDMTLYPRPQDADKDPRFQDGQPLSDLAHTLLTDADLSRFAPDEPDRYNVTETWHAITSNLAYISAFNCVITLVSEEIRIPENKCFRLDLSPLRKLIHVLQDNVDELQQIVDEAGNEAKSIGRGYTPEELETRQESLELLHSLYDNAEWPIRDEQIAAARARLHGLDAFANSAWPNLIAELLPTK